MKERKWGGGTLPKALLALLVLGIGVTYLWVQFGAGEPAPSRADTGPSVEIQLAKLPAKAKPAGVASTDKSPPAKLPDVKPPATKTPTVTAAPSVFRTPGTPGYGLAQLPHRNPLAAAPDPALVQNAPAGALPITSKDGRKSWRVYGRPFNAADKRPKVAVVIMEMGLSEKATAAAIDGLPGAVTLAFAPYAARLADWIGKSRKAGHEVLLGIPMEPASYPRSDPGPRALLTTLSDTENLNRLRWSLGRASGYVGVINLMGSRFTASRRHMAPVLTELQQRGLMFVDIRSAARGSLSALAGKIGVASVSSTHLLDGTASRTAIDARLAALENAARDQGSAVATASGLAVSLERIARWAESLGRRGIVLAPVSALARAKPTG